MKATYDDILALTDQKPKWYDYNGTPRFCDFHPQHSPNIYAIEVVLLEVACQACDRRFQVEIPADILDYARAREAGCKAVTLAEMVQANTLVYGDPPCECSGSTMNSITIKILQFWDRDQKNDWRRRPELEITFPERNIDEV